MSETVLTAAYVVWALFTLAAWVLIRIDTGARNQAWRHIAEERRRLQAARRLLDDEDFHRRFPTQRDELDHYLGGRDGR